MPSRKTGTTPSRKAGQRTRAVKAIEMATPDDALLSGTLADGSLQRIPDTELYWILFKEHPWIRACVSIIAKAVSQQGFSVATVEGDDAKPQTSDDDPRVGQIHKFFSHAFVGRSLRRVLFATSLDIETYGWAFWRRKRAGNRADGQTLYFERLNPRLCKPKLNAAHTAIETYTLLKGTVSADGIVVASDVAEDIPAKDVVFFSFDGGDAALGCPSPLEALDLTAAIDLNIGKHRNATFRNGAFAGTVLSSETANEDQVRAAEKKLLQIKTGARNAYKTLILAGKWQVQRLIASGKNDVDFIKGTGLTREDICAVYSVPPGKLLFSGAALGSSGKAEDDNTFQQEAVLPLEELIYETITMQILETDLDITDLQLIPKRRNMLRLDRFEAAVQCVQFGGTGNEARALVGLPPSTVPGMDTPLFLGSKGQSIADEEPVAPESDPPAPETGSVPDNTPNAGVAQTGAKGKPVARRWY